MRVLGEHDRPHHDPGRPDAADRRRRSGPPDGPSALVLRGRGLGDLLTAVPALRALRGSGRRVLLAAPPELVEVAALTGAVDRLVPARRDRPIPWHGPPPDLAVNLQEPEPRDHRRLLAVRPKELWGFASRDLPGLRGPAQDSREDEVTRCCRLLEWYGVPADRDNLALPVPLCPSPVYRAVVVHPGGGAPARRRPAQDYGEVAAALARSGQRVVVSGSRTERDLAAIVARRAGLHPQSVLAGQLTLRRLCALFSSAVLVVCGDPGIAALARSYGTPYVMVAGRDGTPDRVLDEAARKLATHGGAAHGYGLRTPDNRRRGT